MGMGHKKGLTLILYFLSIATLGWAQIPHSQVVFAYIGLNADSAILARQVKDTDIQLLDNRLRGYLLEIARQENYSIITPHNSAVLLDYLSKNQQDRFHDELVGFSTGLTASGVLYCRLESTGNGGLRFSSTLFSSPGAEIVADASENSPNLDALLDKLPALVYSLFGLPAPIAQPKTVLVQTGRNVGAIGRDREVQIKDIVGNWQGDYGFSKVEIYGDGTGQAWLSDIDTMKIKISLNGQTVSIRQDEPNSPKIYLPVFPYTVAVQIVRLARPMSWDFHITSEKDRMVGTKQTSYFFIENGKILQVDNTYSRDAVWTRTP